MPDYDRPSPSVPTSQSLHHCAYLSLGSNIRPEWYLPRAVTALEQVGRVLKSSPVWESAAVGRIDQAPFCNGAVLLETELDVLPLCWRLREIEQELDRVRVEGDKNAPRTIDLDLSFFVHELNGDAIGMFGDWTLPAEDVVRRPFVAVPLAALNVDFVHPTARHTLGEISRALNQAGCLTLRDDITLPKSQGVVDR